MSDISRLFDATQFMGEMSKTRVEILEGMVDHLICQDVDLARMSIGRVGDMFERTGLWVDGRCVGCVEYQFHETRDCAEVGALLVWRQWWLPPYSHLPSLTGGR